MWMVFGLGVTGKSLILWLALLTEWHTCSQVVVVVLCVLNFVIFYGFRIAHRWHLRTLRPGEFHDLCVSRYLENSICRLNGLAICCYRPNIHEPWQVHKNVLRKTNREVHVQAEERGSI